MATIHVEATVDIPADELWRRVADAGNVSALLDIVAESSLDGETRSCTLADGRELTERILTVDEDRRRVAYHVVEGMPVDHHSASMQVLDEGDGRATLVWITDVWPDAAAERLGPLFAAEMEGLAARL